MNLKKQKEHFKNHIATLTDYGNIKILDFKAPDTNHYRIRFLFEEDYCRLHISGDLGELIACNYNNMTYEKFSDFVNNVGYFGEKIQCHNRPIYVYDYEKAIKDIKEYLTDNDYMENILAGKLFDWQTDEDCIDEFFENVMADFSDDRGLSSSGYDKLSKIGVDLYDVYDADFGKQKTGILDLYMLAFKLAQERLEV